MCVCVCDEMITNSRPFFTYLRTKVQCMYVLSPRSFSVECPMRYFLVHILLHGQNDGTYGCRQDDLSLACLLSAVGKVGK